MDKFSATRKRVMAYSCASIFLITMSFNIIFAIYFPTKSMSFIIGTLFTNLIAFVFFALVTSYYLRNQIKLGRNIFIFLVFFFICLYTANYSYMIFAVLQAVIANKIDIGDFLIILSVTSDITVYRNLFIENKHLLSYFNFYQDKVFILVSMITFALSVFVVNISLAAKNLFILHKSEEEGKTVTFY
ncbi:hypothetical protein MHBO_001876 [Bonamia ostreae]|uniref:NADH dehydrogenase subunit 6 n=1 Tax=Bonamia ostreae TaxID=126728 RepID=A0ABV2AL45_9EUKA